MTWRPYDKLTRAFVTSDQGDKEYFVDLIEYWGVGKCDCPDFRIHREPHLTARPLNPEDRRCKHIAFYRAILARQLLETFIHDELQKHGPQRTNSFPAGTKLKFLSNQSTS